MTSEEKMKVYKGYSNISVTRKMHLKKSSLRAFEKTLWCLKLVENGIKQVVSLLLINPAFTHVPLTGQQGATRPTVKSLRMLPAIDIFVKR